MHSFQDLQEIVNKEIMSYSPCVEPDNLQSPVIYSLGMAGKRIRPVLLLMATEAFGGKYDDALPAARAIEIFHNSTLIHDDIMDQAPLRRNQPTVHKQWNPDTAILSGDLMIIKSYQELAKVKHNFLPDVINVFNKIATQVCEGQQYDLNYETDDFVTLSDYLNMIRLKTSVLLAGALQIGAFLGGADKENAKNMYCYGENLGLAFQLQDDLLDAFGNIKSFGKKIGGDIITNKKTFLLLKALEIAQGPYHDELTSLIGTNKTDDDEKIKRVLEIYKKLNIKNITEDHMLQYYDRSYKYLQKVSIDEKQKAVLYKVSKNLIGRET